MLSDLADLPSIQLTEKDYLRFELDSLTPFGREVAAKELRETPEVKQKAIEDLKNLLQRKTLYYYYYLKYRFLIEFQYEYLHRFVFYIAEDTDLYLPIDNEDWLIRFLRPTKFYPDSARKLVCIYFILHH